MKENSLATHALGITVSLIVQYALGMITNIFVTFPDNAHGGQLWEFAWRQFPLAVHIIVGILVFISALVFMIRSIHAKEKIWVRVSVVGFISILIAGFAGSKFIPSQNDAYSLTMAFAFILAVISYCYGLYATKK